MSKKGKHVAKHKKKVRRNRQDFARQKGLYFEHRHERTVGPPQPDNLDLGLAWMFALLGRRKTSYPELPKEKPDEH